LLVRITPLSERGCSRTRMVTARGTQGMSATSSNALMPRSPRRRQALLRSRVHRLDCAFRWIVNTDSVWSWTSHPVDREHRFRSIV